MGECPLDGKCLSHSVVYQATVTDENSKIETYTGLTKNTFKKRFYKHRDSFKVKDPENSTTLSTHIWKLKESNKQFHVKWSIIGKAQSFNPVTKRCNLCLKEKYNIIFQPEGASLNQRSEFFSTCRHRMNGLLSKL